MNNAGNIKELLSILRCPACKAYCSLEVGGGMHNFGISVPLHRGTIYCEQCNVHYPITDDLIPIMWSDNLKRAFSNINQAPTANHPVDDAVTNLVANVKVYDHFSGDYSKYTRQSSVNGTRMGNSVKKIFPNNKTEGLFHLDFACGPGHVLKWLEPFGFKQIGLDVSLANLRNARKTRSFVVCGDACNMPFADDTC